MRTLWVTLCKKFRRSKPFFKFEYSTSFGLFYRIQSLKIGTFGQEFSPSMQQLIFFGSGKNNLFNFRLRKRILNFNTFRKRETVDHQETVEEIGDRLNEEDQRIGDQNQGAQIGDFGDYQRFTYLKSYLSKGPSSVILPEIKDHRLRWLISQEEDWNIIEQMKFLGLASEWVIA